ncbi:hypothetical protein GBAR_LOCUS17798, partial [Geodia barretti]
RKPASERAKSRTNKRKKRGRHGVEGQDRDGQAEAQSGGAAGQTYGSATRLGRRQVSVSASVANLWCVGFLERPCTLYLAYKILYYSQQNAMVSVEILCSNKLRFVLRFIRYSYEMGPLNKEYLIGRLCV